MYLILGFIVLFWFVFGGLWGPLGCLGCLWTAMGARFVTFGVSTGRLWGIIGLHLSPLGIHWGAFGSHWGHFGAHLAIILVFWGHKYEYSSKSERMSHK